MRRIASFIVPGGMVALAGWMLAAAWQPREPRDAPLLAQAATPVPPSVVTQMDAELVRLSGRLDQSKPFAPAERDPFTYGAPARRARAVEPVAPPLPPPPPLAPELPKLVAITSKATTAGVIRTAVFAASDGVMFAHPGDTIGTLVVRSIGDGVVELADPQTGTRYSVR
jgi:hypothetical protein